MQSPEKGARTSVYLASSAEVRGETGKYFQKSREANPPEGSLDESNARRLWDLCEQLTVVIKSNL
jgi:retinol dehydrogenase-12